MKTFSNLLALMMLLARHCEAIEKGDLAKAVLESFGDSTEETVRYEFIGTNVRLPIDSSAGGEQHDGMDNDLYHQNRCMQGFLASNLDFLDFENYGKWFHENATLSLAETGVYKGIEAIREYAAGPAFFLDTDAWRDWEDRRILPVSFNDTMCVALFTSRAKAITDPATVGEEPVGLEYTSVYKLYWTVSNADEHRTGIDNTDPIPREMNYERDGMYDFKLHRMHLYFSEAFQNRLYGVELDTPAVADFVCDVVMSPGCEETRALNQLGSHEECLAVYNSLPSSNSTGRMDDNTKSCRILHATFALHNPKHCPHLSFRPQEDHKGVVKCQTSSGLMPSDLFSEAELDFIAEKSVEYGFDIEKGYAEFVPENYYNQHGADYPAASTDDLDEFPSSSFAVGLSLANAALAATSLALVATVLS